MLQISTSQKSRYQLPPSASVRPSNPYLDPTFVALLAEAVQASQQPVGSLKPIYFTV